MIITLSIIKSIKTTFIITNRKISIVTAIKGQISMFIILNITIIVMIQKTIISMMDSPTIITKEDKYPIQKLLTKTGPKIWNKKLFRAYLNRLKRLIK